MRIAGKTRMRKFTAAIRLRVGLQLLKHTRNLSGEQVEGCLEQAVRICHFALRKLLPKNNCSMYR